jgi:hypothetical protein
MTASLALVFLADPELGSRAAAQAPGPELLAREPRTPLELWEAVDYLVRTGQAKKAVPYLEKLRKTPPDDETVIAIRNRYGAGSILRLADDAATRPFAQPLVELLVNAARKYATAPERIARLIGDLTKSRPEQDYAVSHLREAGPYAIPFLVKALSRPELSAGDRRLLVQNIGRLDHSAVPALTAVLDSPSAALAADSATALGLIGDKTAIPDLTFSAAAGASPPVLGNAAQAAIARLTGEPFASQAGTPTQVLTAGAWRFHRHQVELPGDPITVWEWDKAAGAPAPRELPRARAEAFYGLRLARKALELSPNDQEAQVVQLSLALEDALERVGFAGFPAQDQATFAAAKARGPVILSEVLKAATRDRKFELAAAATIALGEVTSRAALTSTARPHPLVAALSAPGRRAQFAAAKALVALAPKQPFPGASQVVPTLARFLLDQTLPRAVVIDGNPNRGSQLAGFLLALGYDSELELTGDRGFRAAAESADTELILLSYDLFQKGWTLRDTLANLGADARTAAVPVFIYGPLDYHFLHPDLEHDYPAAKLLVQPVDSGMLRQQLKALPAPSSAAERAGYAREAAALLARIAKDRTGPLARGLPVAEPALTAALVRPETASNAAGALSEIPDPSAQRSLAAVVLDPSGNPALRKQAATALVHSIQQFGRLVTAEQEAHLAASLNQPDDAGLSADLLTIFRALRPAPPASSARPPRQPVPAPSPSPSGGAATPTSSTP